MSNIVQRGERGEGSWCNCMQLEFPKKCKVNKGTVFLTSFHGIHGADKRCSGFRGEPGRYYSCRIVRLCRREWIDLEMRRSRMDRQEIFEGLHYEGKRPWIAYVL